MRATPWSCTHFLLLVLLVISNGSLDVLLYCLCAECGAGATIYLGALGKFLSLRYLEVVVQW